MQLCLSSTDSHLSATLCGLQAGKQAARWLVDYMLGEEVFSGLLKGWSQQVAGCAHKLWAQRLHSSREPQLKLCRLQAPHQIACCSIRFGTAAEGAREPSKGMQALLQLLTKENEKPIYLSLECHDHGKNNQAGIHRGAVTPNLHSLCPNLQVLNRGAVPHQACTLCGVTWSPPKYEGCQTMLCVAWPAIGWWSCGAKVAPAVVSPAMLSPMATSCLVSTSNILPLSRCARVSPMQAMTPRSCRQRAAWCHGSAQHTVHSNIAV